jgi:tRNA modification GTPase
MTQAGDTIFALSSGRLPAAIAVIRISGPRAREALQTLTGRVPEPRRAALVRVRDPQTDEILDEALALFFPTPNSETGEDTAELQLHGGRAVVAGVLEALARLPGFRPAEAGEFTRRAFENGRLDLTQVEGLADLIYADTAAQRRQAFRHLKGLLGERAEAWRTRLVEALALVEAGIDFSDEGDVPDDLTRPALQIARQVHGEIAEALAGAARGERLRDGMVVAIAGPPNAGKSTLLNRLARREAAIVSPHAGTTRDVIEVHLDLDGYPVTLLDTAGIRDSDDPIEQEGVRRARARAAEADLVLWVVDATAGEPCPSDLGDHTRGCDGAAPDGLDASEPTEKGTAGPSRQSGVADPRSSGYWFWEADGRVARPAYPDIWLVVNKIDLAGPSPDAAARGRAMFGDLEASSTSPTSSGLVAEYSALPFSASLAPSDAGLTSVSGQLVGESETWSVHLSAEPESVGCRPFCDERASAHVETAEESEQQSSYDISSLQKGDESGFTFMISAASGKGLDFLMRGLAAHAERFFSQGDSALIIRARHRAALNEVAAALARVLSAQFTGREDILAEELRLAAGSLGRLTGRVDVEELLDVIFRDFCIGK